VLNMADIQEVEDQLTALNAKHKQEKKDLQGKCLSMRKSIPLTNKKKKKELGEQIERMEQELAKQQGEELNTLKASLPLDKPPAEPEPVAAVTSELDQLTVGETREPRVTKAQKRRDKKAEQQRERDQRIAEQEELNREGPRRQEMRAIRRRLRARERAVHDIPSDGDCMYRAIQHQLGQHGPVLALRRSTADELAANQDLYRPYLTDPHSGEPYSDEGYRHYCQTMVETPVWGGQTELVALSAALDRRIEVVQAEGARVVLGEDRPGEPLVVTFHRHMYGLGEHYNSTRPGRADDGEGSDSD